VLRTRDERPWHPEEALPAEAALREARVLATMLDGDWVHGAP
jgi:hypothetical protein